MTATLTWTDRIRNAQAAYPSTTAPLTAEATRRVVNGEEVLVRLLRDVLAVDNVEVRRGQRPDPDANDGRRLLNRLRGQEFTTAPFPEAFRALIGTRSLQQVARRVDLPKTTVHRLLTGERPPQPAEMERIAAAYGKPAAFFAEYRTAMFCTLVAERLTADPDRSAVLAHQLGLVR